MTHWCWPQCMTHETFSTCSTWSQLRKDGIIQTSLVVVLEKIEGPAHMVESDHHLRKRPQPPPTAPMGQHDQANDHLGSTAFHMAPESWISAPRLQDFQKMDQNLNFDLFWPLRGQKGPEKIWSLGAMVYSPKSTTNMPINQVSWSHSYDFLRKCLKTWILTYFGPFRVPKKAQNMALYGPFKKAIFYTHLRVPLIYL